MVTNLYHVFNDYCDDKAQAPRKERKLEKACQFKGQFPNSWDKSFRALSRTSQHQQA